MKRKKKINWQNGDVFLITLNNGNSAVGQTLDLMMPNIVRIAIFVDVIKADSGTHISLDTLHLDKSNAISLVACTREQLDYGVWKIIGNSKIKIGVNDFPNENFRAQDWVGAGMYDASVIESFVNAYNALTPWDDWHKPDVLDALLIDKAKKPDNLIYVKK